MIDNFALGLSHGLMLLAAWRLLSRPDLDDAGLDHPGLDARDLDDSAVPATPPPRVRSRRWTSYMGAEPDA